jgi:DNA-binding MarR family transcriptional regulator
MTIKDTFEPFIFTTNDGRSFQARPHIATFNEKHNAAKSKVFIVLYHARYELEQPWLRLKEIHDTSGVDYTYIKVKLVKWCKWNYVLRKMDDQDGRPHFVYSIAARGKHFVEDILPREWLQQYIADIREYKKNF